MSTHPNKNPGCSRWGRARDPGSPNVYTKHRGWRRSNPSRSRQTGGSGSRGRRGHAGAAPDGSPPFGHNRSYPVSTKNRLRKPHTPEQPGSFSSPRSHRAGQFLTAHLEQEIAARRDLRGPFSHQARLRRGHPEPGPPVANRPNRLKCRSTGRWAWYRGNDRPQAEKHCCQDNLPTFPQEMTPGR